MGADEDQYINSLKAALLQEKASNSKIAAATSIYSGSNDPNLIEWQLELDNILERVEHLLRGDELISKDGNLVWEIQKDKTKQLFNKQGVQTILRLLSMYLNRNTILSNYDEETINWKVYDIGWDLTDLIFMRYESMGLDTKEKIKLIPIIVRQIVDTIHSTYLRALNGGERESLRTARTVMQSAPLQGQIGIPQFQQGKKFSLFRPSTWARS